MEDQNKNLIHNLISRGRKWGMDKLLILLLVGILLLIICIPVKQRGTENDSGLGIYEEQNITANENGYSWPSGRISLSGEREGWITEGEIGQQLQEILQKIDGVGQVDVMITGNAEYNQIEGVVVVAEGADVPAVRQEIIETVQALFPIAAYKVKVCKMAGGKL